MDYSKPFQEMFLAIFIAGGAAILVLVAIGYGAGWLYSKVKEWRK